MWHSEVQACYKILGKREEDGRLASSQTQCPLFCREAQLHSAWEPQSKTGLVSVADVTDKVCLEIWAVVVPQLHTLLPTPPRQELGHGSLGLAAREGHPVSSRWAQTSRPGSTHWCEEENERERNNEKSMGNGERPKHEAGVLSLAWAHTFGAGEGSLLCPKEVLGVSLWCWKGSQFEFSAFRKGLKHSFQ